MLHLSIPMLFVCSTTKGVNILTIPNIIPNKTEIVIKEESALGILNFPILNFSRKSQIGFPIMEIIAAMIK